jgi:hypothetical protein
MEHIKMILMNEADFDREFNIPAKTINDTIKEIVETNKGKE